MELENFHNCYRKIFERTNGFVLNWPIGSNIHLGDFFSIKPGAFSIVGRISDPNMEMIFYDPYENNDIEFAVPAAEPVKDENVRIGISRPPNHIWRLKDGVFNDYFGNKMLVPHKRKVIAPEVNQFITRLENQGSFFFSAKNVKYRKVLDFYKVHKRIIRRLATQFFNYSEIYLVTEVAKVDNYSLGISREENAELVISMDEYFNGDILDLIHSGQDLTIEKANGFEYLKFHGGEGAIAFKALKMSLSMKAKELTIKKIYESQDPEIRDHAVEIINNDLASIIPSIEINSSNASDFFEWRPMSVEDIDVFLGGR